MVGAGVRYQDRSLTFSAFAVNSHRFLHPGQLHDMRQDAPGGDMLSFGFHGMPAHLSKRATALEYGDAEGTPMQGFVRRTLHKESTPIANQISAESDSLMGEVVVSHG